MASGSRPTPRAWAPTGLGGDRYDGSPASEWEFRLDETDDGCTVTQTFRHVPDGLSGIRLRADGDPSRVETIIRDRSKALSDGMRTTLAAIKAVLERDAQR